MKINKWLIILLFIILIYPFLIKYNYVAHNQYEQIPLINRFLNPHYLSNDWSININSKFSPRYFYLLYMSLLAKYISLPAAYYLNYLLVISCVALATFLLTKKLFKSDFISLMTTLFILFGRSYSLGGNDLVGRDLDPPRMAFSLVILGFSLLVYRRWMLGAVFFAAASYIHPLIGFEVPFVFYLSMTLASWPARRFVSIGKSFILYLLLASYPLYTYLQTLLNNKTTNLQSDVLFTILMKIRAPAHYLPSSWDLSIYLNFLLFLALAFSFYMLFRQKFLSFDKKTIINSVSIILLLAFTGYIFTEIIPIYFLAALQLFRLTVIVYWLMAIFLYGSVFYYTFTMQFSNKFKFAFLLLIFIIVYPEVITAPGPTHFLYLILAVIISLFLTKIKINTSKLRYLLIIAVIVNFSLLYRHYSFRLKELYPFSSAETSLEDWVRSNTPQEAIFLTPPDFYSFRLNAERATIIDWLVMPFEPKGMMEWAERISDVSGIQITGFYGITGSKALEGYKTLDENRLNYLRQKYRFDYVVTPKNRTLPLPYLYSNDRYILYTTIKE